MTVSKGNELDKYPAVSKENYDFVQLRKQYMKELRKLTRKNPVAAEILYYLVEKMGKLSNAVVCSYAVLQEITDTSRSTVARAIKVLKEDNWIDSVKIGSANAYAVNERIFWQAGNNQRHHAIFSATVVATKTEQPQKFEEKSKEKLRFVPIVENNLINASPIEQEHKKDQVA